MKWDVNGMVFYTNNMQPTKQETPTPNLSTLDTYLVSAQTWLLKDLIKAMPSCKTVCRACLEWQSKHGASKTFKKVDLLLSLVFKITSQ